MTTDIPENFSGGHKIILSDRSKNLFKIFSYFINSFLFYLFSTGAIPVFDYFYEASFQFLKDSGTSPSFLSCFFCFFLCFSLQLIEFIRWGNPIFDQPFPHLLNGVEIHFHLSLSSLLYRSWEPEVECPSGWVTSSICKRTGVWSFRQISIASI